MTDISEGASLYLRLLGPPTVSAGGKRITFDTRKALALLAYLVVEEGAHPRDRLAAFLWPEGDLAHGRGALRRTLSSLRKHLDERMLLVDRVSIELSGGVATDLAEFRAAVGATAAHHSDGSSMCDGCVERSMESLSLHSGSFMPGFELRDSEPFDEWRYVTEEALRKELVAALQPLVHALIERGAYREALEAAQRWLGLDPLHEPAHAQIMRLHALNDDRTAALEQYARLVEILEEELGVEPLEETVALHRAISAGSTTGTRRARAEPRRGPSKTPFVGRSSELAVLASAFDASRDRGRVVIIEGEAGVGKTRLAREAARRASVDGARLIDVGSHEEEGDHPFGLVARLLSAILEEQPARRLAELDDALAAEVARLAPEMRSLRPDLPVPPPLGDPGAKTIFFAALWDVVALGLADAATILLLEDLQWSDEASLDVLAFIARRIDELPGLVLLTWRSEDVPRDHKLRRLLADMRRSKRGEHVQLKRLERRDVVKLVMECVPDATPATADRVFEDSEGLPFFVSEYVDVLAETDEKSDPVRPASIVDLVRTRLDSTSGSTRQVLAAASVLGRSFDLPLVQATAGRGDEETVDALDELVSRSILAEVVRAGEPSYDFTHEMIRSLAYEETSAARRRLLHGRAPDHLTAPGARTRADDIALAAHHAENAGRRADAARLHAQAGERARSLYANAEALSHFQRALALGHPVEGFLHESSGDMLVLLGRYDSAIRSFESAADPGGPDPRLERKLAEVRLRAGDPAGALEHLERALRLIEEDDPLRPELLADLSLAVSDKDPGEAARLAEEAVTAGTRLTATGAVARAHNRLGILARRAGDMTEATEQLARSLAVAERIEDPSATVAALNNLALVRRQTGDIEDAIELTRRALSLCSRRGDIHREAALHNNLADLMHELGEEEASREHARKAASLFASVGEDDVAPPEIWKLTDW